MLPIDFTNPSLLIAGFSYGSSEAEMDGGRRSCAAERSGEVWTRQMESHSEGSKIWPVSDPALQCGFEGEVCMQLSIGVELFSELGLAARLSGVLANYIDQESF